MKIVWKIIEVISSGIEKIFRGKSIGEKAEAIMDLAVIRGAFDSLGIPTRYDISEKHLFLCLKPDDEFKYQIEIGIDPELSRMRCLAFIARWELDNLQLEKALYFCNSWNSENWCPRAVLDPRKNMIFCDCSFILPGKLPEYFLESKVIKFFLYSARALFVAAVKELGAPVLKEEDDDESEEFIF